MLKGPLASLERHDRPAFEGRSGSERSTEPGSSAKTVASQPVVGYRIRSRTAKKEILVDTYWDGGATWSLDDGVLRGVSPRAIDWIYAKGHYDDFVLAFDYRISEGGGRRRGVSLSVDARPKH